MSIDKTSFEGRNQCHSFVMRGSRASINITTEAKSKREFVELNYVCESENYLCQVARKYFISAVLFFVSYEFLALLCVGDKWKMDEKDEHFITESFNNYRKTISLSVKITQ